MAREILQGIINPFYEEFRAAEPIKNIIEKFWYFKCAKGEKKEISFYLLPSYTSSVVFLRGIKSGDSKFIITSPILKKIKIISSEEIEIAAASVRPLVTGSIFKIKGSLTVNKIFEMKSALDPDIFEDVSNRIGGSHSAVELVKSLTHLFMQLKDKYKQPDKDIQMSLERMLESGGKLKLAEVYETLSISARQFQRKFSALSGLTPKEFLRLVRLSNVASNLVKNGYNHFDVLTEAGYYDQSHYDREFREIYGTKPTEFEAKQKLIKHVNLF